MKNPKRSWRNGLVLTMSILLIGALSSPAKTKEPSPWDKFVRSLRKAFTEPQQKSTKHRSSASTSKQRTPDAAPAGDANAQTTTKESPIKPPDEKNTRSTSKASTRKGEDLPYGTPVPGKQGFVTSPFSPNSGYIDVRGFSPGTPVKDPYTNKVFLTP